MNRVFIGLGTNLGEREKNLQEAVALLGASDGITILKESSVLETKPVDLINQPDFLNKAIIIETSYNPPTLLDILKSIERAMGRTPVIAKGPRLIDLDILVFGDTVLNTPDLKIPHPEIKKRKFILDHLHELDPELVDPETGKKFAQITPGPHLKT